MVKTVVRKLNFFVELAEHSVYMVWLLLPFEVRGDGM